MYRVGAAGGEGSIPSRSICGFKVFTRTERMAACDYRQCDVCRSKTFYDANLNYEPASELPEGVQPYKQVGEPQGYNHLQGLGDWAVLCVECAKTHKTQIVANEKSHGV